MLIIKMSENPTLYIFSGLPGSGKSTLAQLLAPRVNGLYLRIDTIKRGLRDLYSIEVESEGYRLAYRIAADNLRLGVNVVADSCNPLELTRREWEQVALEAQARFVNIEVTCSDRAEHRRRVESRVTEVPGLKLPSWSDVERREYQPWLMDRTVIDTSGKLPSECVQEIFRAGQSLARESDTR